MAIFQTLDKIICQIIYLDISFVNSGFNKHISKTVLGFRKENEYYEVNLTYQNRML